MKISFINTFQRDFLTDFAGNGAVQSSANAAAPGSGVLLGILGGLFANKPNPNDWKGWDAQDSQNNRPPGTTVAFWITTDGDSVQNEALNAISYMRTKTQGVQKVYDAALEQFGLDATAFTAKLVDKLKRAGYPNEAAQFAASYNNASLTNAQPIPLNQPGAATPIGQNTVHVQMPSPTGGTATLQYGTINDTTAAKAAADKAAATKKTWLIVGIVGGVIVLAGVIFAVVKLTKK